MQLNSEIFDQVSLTAVGLISTALVQIGTMFTAERLFELMNTEKEKTPLSEILSSLDELVDNEILFKQDNFYKINEYYLIK